MNAKEISLLTAIIALANSIINLVAISKSRKEKKHRKEVRRAGVRGGAPTFSCTVYKG